MMWRPLAHLGLHFGSKNTGEIDSFLGFIEKFSLFFSNRVKPNSFTQSITPTWWRVALSGCSHAITVLQLNLGSYFRNSGISLLLFFEKILWGEVLPLFIDIYSPPPPFHQQTPPGVQPGQAYHVEERRASNSCEYVASSSGGYNWILYETKTQNQLCWLVGNTKGLKQQNKAQASHSNGNLDLYEPKKKGWNKEFYYKDSIIPPPPHLPNLRSKTLLTYPPTFAPLLTHPPTFAPLLTQRAVWRSA